MNFGTWISRLCRLNRVNGVGIGASGYLVITGEDSLVCDMSITPG